MQSVLSRALHPGSLFVNDRSPAPSRPMGAQRRHPPRQWEGSVGREGARHFVAGTPFLRSGCSHSGRSSEQGFSFPTSRSEEVVMAYNQQYILAGQMHQAQVIRISVKIVFWPLKSVPKSWSRRSLPIPCLDMILSPFFGK